MQHNIIEEEGRSSADSWWLDRRTFTKGAALLGLGGGTLGSLSVPVAAQTIDSWSQKAKLTANGASEGDNFGFAVAVDGDIVIIGTDRDNAEGSAYVFIQQSDGSWSQQKLTAGDTSRADRFGDAVGIYGDTAIVGAPRAGSAYVFRRKIDGQWSQQKLNADYRPSFGESVAIDTNIAIVGAPTEEIVWPNSGAVYVFTHQSDGTWSEEKLTPDVSWRDAEFGSAVAIDGNTVLVGEPSGNDGVSLTGAAFVFTLQPDNTWSQQKLTLDNGDNFDAFGSAVAIDGETAIVGAPGDDDGGSFAGAIYVFARQPDGTWQQTQKLTADDASEFDSFGSAVALDGDTVIVGAHTDGYEGGTRSGSAYVFTRQPDGTWNQEKITATDSESGDLFGWAVAIDGDTAIVGAIGDDGNLQNRGSAYVFKGPTQNQSPEAAFDYLPADPEAEEEITFNATDSTDPDGAGTIDSYDWDFGDGNTGSGQIVEHAYSEVGEYTVNLSVTDDDDATDSTAQTVAVVAFANPIQVEEVSYLPGDLDSDGLFEDVNGDGVVASSGKERAEDISTLAKIIEAYEDGALTLTQAQIEALDFNSDDQLSGADISAYAANRAD